MRGAQFFRRFVSRGQSHPVERVSPAASGQPFAPGVLRGLRRSRTWKRCLYAASFWAAGIAGTASAGTFFVTNNNDSGIGSFRQAILDAEGNAGADDIVFDDNIGTVTLGSPLPTITQDLTVNGGTGNAIDAGGVRSVFVQSGVFRATNLAYSDGTTINGGTVVIVDDANLGDAAGGVTFDNGTLRTDAGVTSARDIVIDAGGGTINTNGFDSTFSGSLSGIGDLTKSGAGTLTLSGSNDLSWTGGTTVTDGVLEITGQDNLGTGTLTLDGGTLRQTTSSFFDRNIELGAAGGTVDFQNGSATVTSTISGSGTLTIDSSGGLFLYGNNTYSGGTIIESGLVLVENGANFGTGDVEYNGGLIIIGGTDVVFNQNFDVTGTRQFRSTNLSTTFTGNLTGTGSINFNAAGGPTVFILEGANTYTGGTSITGLGSTLRLANGGTLASTGALAISSGTTFDLNGQTQTIGTLSGAGDILLGSGALTTDTSDDSTFSGVISGTGSFTKAGSGELTLSGLNTYSGGTTFNGGTVIVSDNANLGDVGGGLTFDGGALRITGNYTAVNRNTTLAAGGGTLDVVLGDVAIFGGPITGTGGLTKTGGGYLFLDGINNYLGETSINGGGLVISSDANLGAGALVFNDGILQTNAGMTIDNEVVFNSGDANFLTNGSDVTLSGNISGDGRLVKLDLGTLTLTGTNSFTGGIDVQAGAVRGNTDSLLGDIALSSVTSSVVFDQATDGAYSGTLSGDGSVTKTGAGRLTLTGTNTYLGGTTINGGALVISDDANLGDASGTLSLDGGTLSAVGQFEMNRLTTLGAGGGTFETQDIDDDLTLHGVIQGSGGLTKTGDGFLELAGTNTYLGGTTINGGFLGISDDTNLGDASGALRLDGGTLTTFGSFDIARNITLGAGGGAFEVYDDFDEVTLSGTIDGVGGLTKTGFGLLELTGTNTYLGDTTIHEGGLAIDSDASLGDLSGDIHIGPGAALGLNNDITTARNVTLDLLGGIATLGGTSTFTGVISGNGVLSKLTEGTLILDGANTYDGGTIVEEGTLRLGANGSLSSTGDLVILPDATFDLNGRTQTVETLLGEGFLLLGSGAFTTDSDFDGLYGGVISGTGSFTKAGDSVLELYGINTHTGGTNINGGGLIITDDANLGDTASVLSFDGGFLHTYDAITSQRNVTLNSGGGTIDTEGYDSSFSGVFSGSGGLTKEGDGRLELLGTNTYLGQTVINGGNLAVNGSLTSDVFVNHGGTLSGNGQVGSVTNDGVVGPGNSIDTLQIAGNYSQTANGILEIEIDPGSGNTDLLEITGTATIAGTLDITGGGSAGFSVNQTYTFLTAAGGVTGTFDPVTEDLAFLGVMLDYSDPNAVSFTLALDGTTFANVAVTPNEIAVATTLDTISPGATGDTALILQDILSMTAPEARAAYNQLSGEIFASSSAASIEQGQSTLRNMAERLRRMGADETTGIAMRMPSPDQAFSLVSSGDSSAHQDVIRLAGGTGSATHVARGATFEETLVQYLEEDVYSVARTWDGWIEGSGQTGNFASNGNAAATRYGFGGTNFGAGYYLDNNTVVGVLGGYYNSTVRGGGSGADRAEIGTTQVGLYARSGFGQHYVLGIVNYGNQDYATDRVVNIGGVDRNTAASYNADQLGTLIEYGQNRALGAFVLQPLASIQYINQQTDSYTEQATGGGGATLNVAGGTDDSLRGALGARLLLPFQHESGRTFIPEIHARYMYEFLDSSQNIGATFTSSPGTPFTIQGVSAGENFFVYGAGASYMVTQHVSLYGHYIGQATSQLTSHTGTGGLQVTW